MAKASKIHSRPRAAMADVAKAANVSVSAVSLALRNSPLISPQTRARIQSAASRLGYVPDPHVARLMGYLRQPSAAKRAGTLAYLTAFDPPEAWRFVPVWRRYFAGAQRRAAELGYNMEEFSVRAGGLTSKRVSRVLQARGINGVVVAPLPEGAHELELPWEPFSAVAIGLSLWAPHLHTIVHHHLASMALALQAIRTRGYRRIALVLEPNHDLRVQHHWSAAFLAEQRCAGLPGNLIFDQLDAAAAFVTWFRRHRPDVILGDNLVAARILDAAGYRIPRDCAFVVLNLAGHERGFAGINQLSEAIGTSAVSRLVGSLRQNEFGVPALPEVTFVPGQWVDGASLPQKGTTKERVVPPPLDPSLKRLR